MKNYITITKGASFYKEEDREYFKGRSCEIDDLINLIVYNNFSVLYASSGEGKSSLIHAGLKPELRKNGFFPITIRFTRDNLLENHVDFDKIVDEHITNAIESTDYIHETSVNGIDKECSGTLDRLTNKIYCVDIVNKDLIKSWKDIRVTPILIFDQFEEIFYQDTTASFFAWFNELYNHSIKTNNFKVLVSLRSDYISELDYWGMQRKDSFLPQLKNNRYCLKPLSKESANEILDNYDLTDKYKSSIVRASKAPWINNLDKIKDNEPSISALALQMYLTGVMSSDEEIKNIIQNNDEQVSLQKIIQSYYEKTLEKAGIEINSEEQDLFEESLVTDGGRRNTVSLETDERLTKINFKDKYYETLKENRIVSDKSIGSDPQSTWIELAHDCFLQVAFAHKKSRIKESEQRANSYKEALIKNKKRTLNLWYYICVNVLALGWLYLTYSCLWNEIAKSFLDRNSSIRCGVIDITFMLLSIWTIIDSISAAFNNKVKLFRMIAELGLMLCITILWYYQNLGDFLSIQTNSPELYYVLNNLLILCVLMLFVFFAKSQKEDSQFKVCLGYRPVYLALLLTTIFAQILTVRGATRIDLVTNLYDIWPFCCFIPLLITLVFCGLSKRFFKLAILLILGLALFLLQLAGIENLLNIRLSMGIAVLTVIVIGAKLGIGSSFKVKIFKYFLFVIICLSSFIYAIGYDFVKISDFVDRQKKCSTPWGGILVKNGTKLGYSLYNGEILVPCVFDEYSYLREDRKSVISVSMNCGLTSNQLDSTLVSSRKCFPFYIKENKKLNVWIHPSCETEMLTYTDIWDIRRADIVRQARKEIINSMFSKDDGKSLPTLVKKIDNLYKAECNQIQKYINNLKPNDLNDSVLNKIRSDIARCLNTLQLTEAIEALDSSRYSNFVHSVASLQDFCLYNIKGINSKFYKSIETTITSSRCDKKDTIFSNVICLKDLYDSKSTEWLDAFRYLCYKDIYYNEPNFIGALQKYIKNQNNRNSEIQKYIQRLELLQLNFCKDLLSELQHKEHKEREKQIVQNNMSQIDTLVNNIIDNFDKSKYDFRDIPRFKLMSDFVPKLCYLINQEYPDYNSGVFDLCRSIIEIGTIRGCNMSSYYNILKNAFNKTNKSLETMQCLEELKEITKVFADKKRKLNEVVEVLESNLK